MTPETKILKEIINGLAELKKRGKVIWWMKIVGSPLQKRGLPDLLIISDGYPLFVEVKSEKGKPTRLQEHILRELHHAGVTAIVARSWEDVLEGIKATYWY